MKSLNVAFAFAFFSLAIAGNAPAVQYTITDLGTFGGTYSYANAINSGGQVVGEAFLDGDTASHAFLYSGATMTDLGTLGGTYSNARGINNSGQIVGDAWIPGDATYHAFLYSGATMTDLGALGGTPSGAAGINNYGQVVGFAYTMVQVPHAFLYSGSTMTDLGTLGGIDSAAAGINDMGQVVGSAYIIGNTARHAFLYSGSTMADLGTLGGTNSDAQGINLSGQVVGCSDTAGNAAMHAFLYSGSTMTDLGTLGGGNSAAYGINNSGQIVGSYNTDDAGPCAFLWNGSTMIDLNSLIDPESGWGLAQAMAINDAGQIVGSGVCANGDHAFLLTPIPEPSTLVLLLIVALSLLAHAWRRRMLARFGAQRLSFPAGLLAFVLLASLPTASSARTFVNVVDNTMMALQDGTFSYFNPPSISGGLTAFSAGYDTGAGFRTGIFTGNGGPVTTIANIGDTIPGGTLVSLGDALAISGGTTAFWGFFSGSQGIFTSSGGVITPIAMAGDPAPGGTFLTFGELSVNAGTVAFVGSYTSSYSNDGIFTSRGGVLTTIAKAGDAAPVGTFDYFLSPSIDGERVAFCGEYGSGTRRGIFVSNGTTITPIAKTGDPAPSGTFDNFDGGCTISGSVVAFHAGYGDTEGIFTGSGGAVTTIAKTGDPAPVGTLDYFGPPSINAGTVAFWGRYNSDEDCAVFTSTGGELTTIIKTGDDLFGSTVTDVDFGGGLDPSGDIGFRYELADGRFGLAIAQAPEPSALALLAVGALSAFGYALRRRCKTLPIAAALVVAIGASVSRAVVIAETDPVTFNLPGSDLMSVNVRVTYPLYGANVDQTQQSSASGSILSNLTVAYDTSTHAASVSGSGLGISFVAQDPGQISLGTLNYDMYYSPIYLHETATVTGMKLSLSTPGATAPVTGASLDLTGQNIIVNAGTAIGAGFDSVTYNFADAQSPGPIVRSLTGLGSLSISSPNETVLTSGDVRATYVASLHVPVNFSAVMPTTPNGLVITPAWYGTLNATGTFTHTFAEATAGGGTESVGGVSARFSEVTTPGSFTSTFLEPTTPTELSQAIGAAAGEINFALPGSNVQLWDLAFSGSFTGDTTVVLNYDPSLIGNADPSSLFIEHFENGSWTLPANQVVDPVAHTITFTTGSFSPFILAVPEPSPFVLLTIGVAGLFGYCLRRRWKIPRTLPLMLAAPLMSLSVLSGQALAEPYTGILSFGDSLTDNGTSGSDIYGNGRYTNGPVWAEYLADPAHLNVPLFDMAYGGATTSSTSPNLGWQVNTYLSQVSSFVPPGTLVTIWAGANDYSQGSPSTSAANVAAAAQKLADAGGQYFLIPNLPDAGRTPGVRALGPFYQSLATSGCQQFNSYLATDLHNLQLMYPNDRFYSLDTFTLLDTVIANPSAYGFTNVTSPSSAPGYLFYDDVHPTTQAHALLADYAMATVGRPTPEPPAGIIVLSALVVLAAVKGGRSTR